MTLATIESIASARRADSVIGSVRLRPPDQLARFYIKTGRPSLLLESWEHFIDHGDCGGANEYNENSGKDE